MHRVGKVVPPKRHILKNISLSFFPGAKIGVLGLNGAKIGVLGLNGCF
ncbi:ABC transporter ATP-binding protein yjjK [Salmonella enterica subsp. enterica serovar Alachua str. R6-377]|uniref:ABC transporter ATP-binding protein yjjK n=1 Tax=Salmonella enterica subsp. enterica serovar Alachua str. R6-377 TaxID=913241 RepID=G5LXZ6_SALET|nr:ABC transporter ATP-binding protein yjjK [Salmonella enterica subsp. enterica serovar Alachua str. R6-377]